VTARRRRAEAGRQLSDRARHLLALSQTEHARQAASRWFPLADWQREKLSLLLNPGRGRHDAT
jgi:hypothetical protein